MKKFSNIYTYLVIMLGGVSLFSSCDTTDPDVKPDPTVTVASGSYTKKDGMVVLFTQGQVDSLNFTVTDSSDVTLGLDVTVADGRELKQITVFIDKTWIDINDGNNDGDTTDVLASYVGLDAEGFIKGFDGWGEDLKHEGFDSKTSDEISVTLGGVQESVTFTVQVHDNAGRIIGINYEIKVQ
jgi:hypothetical protein